ncbi:hypothetical protein OAD64_00270 [Oceanospirillaceae bacterium]|jgi:hypothetical protein|nr:hypothetical protein [Oceanospirillaceae bacterium]|tara:strand:+ start:551 stop:931 length:381 start_codon:yes stop_codon:yes gene_type:complete
MLISDKAIYVSSMTGQSAWFEAGVAREVPPPLVDECIAAGAYLVGKQPQIKQAVATETASENSVDGVSEEDRAMEIVAAIEQLMEKGDNKAFSKNGDPRVQSIEKILGYDITSKQRDAAWAVISEA